MILFTEAVVQRCSTKYVFLKISQKIHGKTPVSESEACNFIKQEALAQVFSSEFCETLKNNVFHRTPQVSVSVFGTIIRSK